MVFSTWTFKEGIKKFSQGLYPSNLATLPWYLKVVLAEYYLQIGHIVRAKDLYEQLSSREKSLLESLLLKSKIYSYSGRYQEALSVLESIINRYLYQESQELVCAMALAARSNLRTIPLIRDALQSVYQSADILCSAAQLQMLQKKPADARRTSLLVRIQSSLLAIDKYFDKSNLLNLYMELGNVDWLDYSINPYTGNWLDISHFLRQNLCMQFASYHSSRVKPCIDSVINDMTRDVSNVGQFTDNSDNI